MGRPREHRVLLVFSEAGARGRFLLASGALRVEQILQVPSDWAQSITSLAVDRQGNLIVTGSNLQGGFVSKLDPTGSTLLYSTYLGGQADSTNATGIAVSVSGEAYITGTTNSTSFPVRNALPGGKYLLVT